MDNYVITIARGFGSGGRQIAAKLAEELGINWYERRVMALASQYSGYGEEYFQDEKLKGSLFINSLMKLPISLSPKPVLSRFTSDPKMFDIQSHIIRELAQTESCIIVGKCADYVLRDHEKVLSLYIEAPREYCIDRVMQDMPGTTREEAGELIVKTDHYRSEYYKYYTNGCDWRNPTNYDLTINTGRLGDEKTIKIIKNTLRVKFGEDVLERMKQKGMA